MKDTMPDDDPDRTPESLRALVRSTMEAAWNPLGYTAPNTAVYPWLWLWDSCFHSLVWHELGEDERAILELGSVLRSIDAAGFVPHMGYQADPDASVEFWGRRGSSSITQPPMYGHVIAELDRAGVDVSEALIERATRGLTFLLQRRARDPDSGLVQLVHPWESGCDDSPRWDDFCPGDHFDRERWRGQKGELLAHVEFGSLGEPLGNPAFAAAPVGFNALVAFNARELAAVTGDVFLQAGADELAAALDHRFDHELRTWVDGGAAALGSGTVRTADALLPLLVTEAGPLRHLAIEELLNEDGFASMYGPRGVHIGEPTYDHQTYWRGPVWPQIAYLLWTGLVRGGAAETDAAEVVRTTTRAGAEISGLAEYWDGDRGTGLGAIPQSWTGLSLILDGSGVAGHEG